MTIITTTIRRFAVTRSSAATVNYITRPLSTTSPDQLQKPIRGTPPTANHPPSAKAHGRTKALSDDAQSSASTQNGDEKKSGDDHPAKQPDPQEPSSRSTGFNEKNEGGVAGGKEGLHERTDKK